MEAHRIPLALPRVAAHLALLRPLNAAIAFAGACAGGLIAGAGSTDMPLLLACGAAAFLLTAGGNILNDVFDTETDRINRPQRPMASGAVARPAALYLYAFCTATGIGISAVLSLPLFLVAVSAAALAAAYNATLKRVPLLGNIVVGALSGTIFLYGALAVNAPAAGVIPAAFAAVYTVAREILKDIEDVEGDRAAGIRTLPIAAGPDAAANAVIAILLSLFVASPLPYFIGNYSVVYLAIIAVAVQTVLAYGIVTLLHSRDRRTAAALSRVLKYDMLAGMAAFLAGRLAQ